MSEATPDKQEEKHTGWGQLKHWAKVIYLGFISFMLFLAAAMAF